MSMQAYYLVFYPLPEKFWELLKPSYKKVLTSPVVDLFVTLLTDKHQFNEKGHTDIRVSFFVKLMFVGE